MHWCATPTSKISHAPKPLTCLNQTYPFPVDPTLNAEYTMMKSCVDNRNIQQLYDEGLELGM